LIIDALETGRRRLAGVEFIVTPTVIEEIVLKAERGDTPRDRRLAERVLASLTHPWDFHLVNFIPVRRGIIAEVAGRLSWEKLIPESEVKDALYQLRMMLGKTRSADLLVRRASNRKRAFLFEASRGGQECPRSGQRLTSFHACLVLIVAEAAFIEATLLLSSDAHIKAHQRYRTCPTQIGAGCR